MSNIKEKPKKNIKLFDKGVIATQKTKGAQNILNRKLNFLIKMLMRKVLGMLKILVDFLKNIILKEVLINIEKN